MQELTWMLPGWYDAKIRMCTTDLGATAVRKGKKAIGIFLDTLSVVYVAKALIGNPRIERIDFLSLRGIYIALLMAIGNDTEQLLRNSYLRPGSILGEALGENEPVTRLTHDG
jgi:hypothetical protein